MKYTIVLEKTDTGYGAFVPDLPGCIAAGETREEVMARIEETIKCHLEDSKENHISPSRPL